MVYRNKSELLTGERAAAAGTRTASDETAKVHASRLESGER